MADNEPKTILDLAPDKFVLPGRAKDPRERVPEDLVFYKDKSADYLVYWAKMETSELSKRDANGFLIENKNGSTLYDISQGEVTGTTQQESLLITREKVSNDE